MSRATAEAHGMAEAAVANARIHGGAWEYAVALVFRTHRGEIAEARRLVTEAETATGRGSPPSHFTAVVQGLDARIPVYEPGPGSGPAAGVRGLTSALRGARDARCAELVTGHLADGAGAVLSKAGRHGEAVRFLAAGDSRRLTARRLTGS
ncbi:MULTISPECIES: hypothetical protein [unclassified Streptomyces]|uniref:hypothetical protein n=1 Tax=unclassified Streptomyces TaxID=2593676 RepID=UPI002E0FB332|nr:MULTISPECIES: hypothetical protein [unclassified Streptomyces]WSJ37322.1 hypothetical protein OG772_15585 [Streptomyces sp. NBC_01321]WSP63717.1 hypothetical protein OG466_18795 [Streptomyces sp. NBC_01240]